jgi:hypothetical protein
MNVEVPEVMIDAGVKALSAEYGLRFDPLENDPRHFVMRLYQAMQKVRPQPENQDSVDRG